MRIQAVVIYKMDTKYFPVTQQTSNIFLTSTRTWSVCIEIWPWQDTTEPTLASFCFPQNPLSTVFFTNTDLNDLYHLKDGLSSFQVLKNATVHEKAVSATDKIMFLLNNTIQKFLIIPAIFEPKGWKKSKLSLNHSSSLVLDTCYELITTKIQANSFFLTSVWS